MKLSIITINYNNAEGLKKTINSVVSQTYRDFEYIIIDGGSTDKSVEYIQAYKSYLAHWVSEKDHGVYNAMNKGLRVAKGDYILMLNSGDRFASDNVLQQVFSANPDADIFYTDVLWEQEDKIVEERQSNQLSFDFFRYNFLCHQAIYARRQLHDLVGPYDETLKIIADQKFLMLSICRHNASYQHIPFFSVICEWGGLSKQAQSWQRVLEEKKQIVETEFPAFLPDYREFDRVRKELDDLNRKLYNRVTHRVRKIFRKSQG